MSSESRVESGIQRVHRYTDSAALADAAADWLLKSVVARQASQGLVHVSLAGGAIANSIYKSFTARASADAVDPNGLELWWSSERFVETTDPSRNASRTLGLLGLSLPLTAAQVHPMPAKSGHADPDEAAVAYAIELGDTIFDLCLLGFGADGHVAAIFPDHPSFAVQASTNLMAVGVTDAPTPPPERITLTFNALNRSKEVWIFVSGTEKSEAFAAVMAGDLSLPASHVHGTEMTRWFVDADAARLVPDYRCSL